jgi:hypothetical protein
MSGFVGIQLVSSVAERKLDWPSVVFGSRFRGDDEQRLRRRHARESRDDQSSLRAAGRLAPALRAAPATLRGVAALGGFSAQSNGG